MNLLEKVSCHRLIATQITLATLLDGIKSELVSHSPEFELSIEEVPSLFQIYTKLGHETAEDPFEAYPPGNARPGLTDVAFYLHSSGSTGFPKAIPQTHGSAVSWASFRELFVPPHDSDSVLISSFSLAATIARYRDDGSAGSVRLGGMVCVRRSPLLLC